MIKKFLKRLVYGYKASSESYIKYLRAKGAVIGEGVKIFRPGVTTIDVQNPHLLKIGNYVQITGPVTILTHDYSWSVLKKKYGEILGNQNNVTIGDNCFIGWGATILAGTTIGNNVIIGAQSVVKGCIDSNSVYAGNPAKKIMSIEEFYEKRKKKQNDEAINFINEYTKAHGRDPQIDDLNEYFFLFTSGTNIKSEKFLSQLECMGNKDESIAFLKDNKPMYSSFESLLETAKLRGDNDENKSRHQ